MVSDEIKKLEALYLEKTYEFISNKMPHFKDIVTLIKEYSYLIKEQHSIEGKELTFDEFCVIITRLMNKYQTMYLFNLFTNIMINCCDLNTKKLKSNPSDVLQIVKSNLQYCIDKGYFDLGNNHLNMKEEE